MKTIFIAILTLSTLTFGQAYADDSHESNYDSIVRDLTASNVLDTHAEAPHDALDQVKFHLSGGLVSSQLALDLPGPMPSSTTLHGYEVGLGIDLFSPAWVAQFDVRTYDPDDISKNQITFHEFDLLVMHQANVGAQLTWQIGGGLAARYLELETPVIKGGETDFSTPASVFATGLGFSFTPGFSVDAVVSLRTRLVENTPDGGSFDGTMHLTGHF